MSTADPQRLIDGFAKIRRGVHSGIAPNQLDRDQLSFAINTVLRSGIPRQRPAIRKRELSFASPEAQTAFEQGFWQGGYPYSYNPISCLCVSISGRFYTIDPLSFEVQDLTLPTPSQPWQPIAWFEQAEMFLIRQDGGWSVPLIFDGTTLRESDRAAGEVPGGRMMKYALGRLWLVNPNERDFIAGDLVFGPSGTEAYGFRDSVLKFTENDFLNEGGAFTVGDRITAMRQQATIDTTLGEGPLAVFFKGGAALVNAPFDRTLWKSVTYPIQTIGALSHGALGQGSTLNVNNDIWYRADDGLRSFKAARRDSENWGDTPLSYEMDRVIRFDQLDLFDTSSGVLFNNRLLQTASPVIVPLRGVAYRGLISLDFQQVSSVTSISPSDPEPSPAYDGIWTGLRILYICTLEVQGISRCYIFALDVDDKISLYELTKDELFDNDGTQRVAWEVETPAYRFGFDNIDKNKLQLMGANLFRSDLRAGETSFFVGYRSDNYPLWIEPTSWFWKDCVELSCLFDGCNFQPNLAQYRPPKLLPNPEEECETASNKLSRLGREFQARVRVFGPAQLDLFRFWTYDFPEARYEECVAEALCETLQGCSGYLFDYEIGP